MTNAHFSTGTVKLAQDLAKLVNNRQGSDVQFRIGGGITDRNVTPTGETIIDTSTAVTIYAHSAILSCRSRHFARILEHSSGVVYMPDVSPNVFESLLDFIYTGNVNVKLEYLLGLIRITEEMKIEELGIMCQAMVMHVLDRAFSTEEEDEDEDEDENGQGENENDEAESNFEEAYFLEHKHLSAAVAVHEILVPALRLADSLNLKDFFRKLSNLTNTYMEFILASPETRPLFIQNIPKQIFAKLALQNYNTIFKMKKLPIPSSLRVDIALEYQRLSENGDILALSRLGLCWQYGFGVEQDPFLAVECFKRAAEAENTDAQSSLGFCYHKGYGVAQDYIKAVELYTKAAEAGNTVTQNNLGICYQNGYGVPRNPTKAVELYTKAANAGNADAQNNLGICYEDGFGVAKDYTKAVKFYAEAVKAGNTNAQNNLGLCYQSGHGVTKDCAKAVELYTMAVSAGNIDAHNSLAFCYEKGRGVNKDYVKAVQLYTKAADTGSTKAKLSLLTLRKRLA